MSDVKPITQAQAAALLGVTLRHLQRLIAEDGSAPPKIENANGRAAGIPCAEYGDWLRRRWAMDNGLTESGEIYNEKIERARLLHHQANNEALKESENRGRLIPAELVVELGSSLVAAARAKVLAIASKIRGRFPALDQDVVDEVETLSREALEELGKDGLPADLRRRIEPHIRSMESAAESLD